MGFFSKPRGAQRAAEAAEAERIAAMGQNRTAVDAAFNSGQRQQGVTDYMDSLRSYLGDDLLKQKKNTDRQQIFSLARNGQLGSSVQVDQGEEINDNFLKGQLELERRVNQGGDQLRDNDEQARSAILSMSSNGLDATTGARRSSENMLAALEQNRQKMLVDGLGDIFSSAKGFWEQSKINAERRRARQDYGMPSQNTGLSGPRM
jgi:hypothetical protein